MSSKALGNLSKGLIFVISAPAGTGKTTLVKMLLDEFSCVAVSVSCTTRIPRPHEINGKDYYFLSEKEFKERIAKQDFLEYAKVFGNYYGTSRSAVFQKQEEGKHVLLVIDTQGALQLKKKQFPAIFIFICPPSLEILQSRLEGRETESIESLHERLSWAQEEINQAKYYDYSVINENLDVAYAVMRSILIAEEHKIRGK